MYILRLSFFSVILILFISEEKLLINLLFINAIISTLMS